jgi:hypothetical protein
MPRGFDQVVQHVMGTWTVTPYRLCDYRCSYCCTRVQGRSDPVLSASEAVAEVERTLDVAGPDSFWVIGGLSDAYPSTEAQHRITRELLSHVLAAPVRWCLVTKSLLVERDLDLLLGAVGAGTATISISSTDDAALARLDGHAPPPSERIALVHRLHAAGLSVDVNVLPFLPGVTDLDDLLDALPPDVRVTVSPLLFGDWGDQVTLAGNSFRRPEVWDAYLATYERLGHLERLSWIKPCLPPGENNPFVRLPTLAAPMAAESDLRRELRSLAERHATQGEPSDPVPVALGTRV